VWPCRLAGTGTGHGTLLFQNTGTGRKMGNVRLILISNFGFILVLEKQKA